MFHGIRWRVALPYMALILLATLALTGTFSKVLWDESMARLQAELTAEARLAAEAIGPRLADAGQAAAIDPLVKSWAGWLDGRLTIIRADGVVLGDSGADPLAQGAELDRPEVQQALAGRVGVATRTSQGSGAQMMVVAVPVEVDGQRLAVASASAPLAQPEASIARLRQTVWIAALFTALVGGLLALLIAERTARPVRRLTQVAERMAQGDLNARLLLPARDEVGQLARTLNHMAEQLRRQMATLAEERSRLATVLERMGDGVLMTDCDGQVQLINPAAGRLLNTAQTSALGHSLAEVVRDHRIIELWQDCRRTGEAQIGAVETDHQRTFLQAVVTPFQEAQTAAECGYLLILQDLTQIRRLETVRRDFISNISHELRTPLAALKALVDTLRDGALEDLPAARRFLTRMETEVDALTQIVQELLELARIESGQVPLRLAPSPVGELVLPAVGRLQPPAERAGLALAVDLPPNVPLVLADAERVRQVVTNLVHNAIKFTPRGGQVRVSAAPSGDEVVIQVRDTGVGIPADDLPRIFERFYKANRARTGGGTGLGLAIARHIVQAHAGRIWVESIEGKGSTFYFSLPIADR